MKVNLSLDKLKPVVGIAAAVYAAIAAFADVRESQRQAKAIEELETKITKLEKGES